ncbi:MAG: Gfo/Idh/MocA family oxidoreductase [Planctomycetaceae bacterium]|nr:Gfo/Idh/MocA family oxidoreductase [Planctomycetaceae bacterium]
MAKKTSLNVALIGQGFMGRTHSNAWGQVAKFFKVPVKPVMHTSFGQPEENPAVFAERWGWQNVSDNWQKTVKSSDIDLVDVVTPNYMHAKVAMAALAAGKNVSCEKPIAGTLAEARDMVAAAKKARVKTFVWYNYRRCPAVALAYKLVQEGRIGEIRHVRARYLQDWAGDSVPLVWRFDKKLAGSGAHGDLNAHVIDMARFVTGQEVTEICGAIAETFIKERALASGTAGGKIADSGGKGAAKKGKVTVDDTVLFLARFSGGAVGSFEAARQATGHQNDNGVEINGTKGSLKFSFEDMNYLEYYDATAPRHVQGWTKIMVTHGGDHPYIEAWWPDAHILGYEHGFVNQAYDILQVLSGQKPVVPIPDFNDAYQTQRVLEAALLSASSKKWVKMADVK